jgi:hypothetical protein
MRDFQSHDDKDDKVVVHQIANASSMADTIGIRQTNGDGLRHVYKPNSGDRRWNLVLPT